MVQYKPTLPNAVKHGGTNLFQESGGPRTRTPQDLPQRPSTEHAKVAGQSQRQQLYSSYRYIMTLSSICGTMVVLGAFGSEGLLWAFACAAKGLDHNWQDPPSSQAPAWAPPIQQVTKPYKELRYIVNHLGFVIKLSHFRSHLSQKTSLRKYIFTARAAGSRKGGTRSKRDLTLQSWIDLCWAPWVIT